MSDEQAGAADRVPTGVELTALDPAFRTDPYPVLARLLAREPVYFDGVIKRWVLTRREHIRCSTFMSPSERSPKLPLFEHWLRRCNLGSVSAAAQSSAPGAARLGAFLGGADGASGG